MTRLRRGQLEAVVELLGVACELEGPEAFPVAFLEQLRQTVRGSEVVFGALDRRAQTSLDGAYAGEGDVIDPDRATELDRIYWKTVHTCPTFRYRDRTGDQRAVRLSDLVSRRAYHRLPIYQEYFRPQSAEHGLEVPLPAPAGIDRFLILWRTPLDPDFSDSTRDLLEVLRPHLARMHERGELRRRVTEAPRPPSGLTRREQEILDLVADGKTNAEIARILWVAPSTVAKHLENVYAKLGVRGRTAAAMQFRGVSARR